METIEQLKPTATAEAESYAEHKAARIAPPKGEEKKAEPPAEKKETPEVDGKTAAPKEEGEKPAKKSGVPERIKELTEARKKAEEEAERLRKELEEARKPKAVEPKPEAKTETPKPEAEDTTDPRPKLKDFVAKLKADETYEDAVERHTEAVLEWRDRQAEKKRTATEAEQRAGTVKEQFAGRVRDAQTKHEDFEAKTDDLAPLMSPVMRQFVMEHPEGVEVAYHLGGNRDELEAIKKLAPLVQVGMLGAIAARLKAPTQQPEKKQISRAPAPPPRVGGVEAPPAKDTSEALTYAEHKRLRTQGR